MEVPEELRVAIKLAEEAGAGKGEKAEFARQVADLMAKAVQKIEAAGKSKKANMGKVEYLVESIGGTEALAEYRTSGKSNAIRCQKALYDAVAGVLGAADRALGVEEIASAVERATGERPAEFQLRVPLRFWLSMETPLVVRMRARYRATETTGFTNTASKLWADLRVR
jgi:hypothetical protein